MRKYDHFLFILNIENNYPIFQQISKSEMSYFKLQEGDASKDKFHESKVCFTQKFKSHFYFKIYKRLLCTASIMV